MDSDDVVHVLYQSHAICDAIIVMTFDARNKRIAAVWTSDQRI